MGIVYRMEFEDGKSYIGITTKALKRRWAQHKSASSRNNAAVYVAWRRLGEPKLSVVMEVPDDELKAAEIAVIELFYSQFPNGYNATQGGDGGALIVRDETREKMAAAKRGKKMSDENKRKIRAAIVGRVKSPEERAKLRDARIGMKFSPEWRRNIGLSKVGGTLSPEHIAKISLRHTGRKNSPETIAKMSASAKAREARKREGVQA